MSAESLKFHQTIKNFVITLVLFLSSFAYSGSAVWTFTPQSATKITVPSNQVSQVVYLVQNNSSKPKILSMNPIKGVIQDGDCVLAPKGSCILTLNIVGSELSGPVTGGPVLCQKGNLSQCYQPSKNQSLDITLGEPNATISVNPTALSFTENSTASITVTNNLSSPVGANNIAANIPGNSAISVSSSTCGAVLQPGANCTIIFTASAPQGPTTIPIHGDNTNTINVEITVFSQALISITNPALGSRVVAVAGMTPLSIEITNDINSLVNANNVSVSNTSNCTNLFVDDSQCTNIAPGASCLLELSSNSPYAPCTVTIGGTNTNSVQTAIAFSYLGGLVFEENLGVGKIVLDQAGELNVRWTLTATDIPSATSFDIGTQNTTNIVNAPPCSNSFGNCAAYRCRNLGGISTPEWYLPALNELIAVYNTFCGQFGNSCIFGGPWSLQPYKSSTQDNIQTNIIYYLYFQGGIVNVDGKTANGPTRCIRTF